MHHIFSFVQLWKWFQQDCNTQKDIKSPAFGLYVSSPGTCTSSTCHKIRLISFEIYIKYSLFHETDFLNKKRKPKTKYCSGQYLDIGSDLCLQMPDLDCQVVIFYIILKLYSQMNSEYRKSGQRNQILENVLGGGLEKSQRPPLIGSHRWHSLQSPATQLRKLGIYAPVQTQIPCCSLLFASSLVNLDSQRS